MTAHPPAPWGGRQILHAMPWSQCPRFLMRDRDTSSERDFIPQAAARGIRTSLTPGRAPQATAIAERVSGSLRRECLVHVIVVNAR